MDGSKSIEDVLIHWKKDRSDNTNACYGEFVHGSGLLITTKSRDEGYGIQFYDPEAIKNDRRKSLIRIYHYHWPSKIGNHGIDFVIDLKNHHGHMPFHLNLSGLSRKTACAICKKYFYPLDHFEIVSSGGLRELQAQKALDFEATYETFKQELARLGLFKEFPITLTEYPIR